MLRDGAGRVGIIYEVVGEDDHLVGVMCVREGISEGSADTLGVFTARISGGVAERVARGGAQEGHVDVDVTVHDGASASAVGAELYRFLHEAVGDGVGQCVPHTRGADAGDDSLLDVFDERRMDSGKARRCEGEVLESHLGQFGDHHVDDLVAAAEMVVEGDGHSILEPGLPYSLFEGDDLRADLFEFSAEGGVLAAAFLIYGLAQPGSLGSYSGCPVFQTVHYCRSSFVMTPAASARSIVRCALRTTGRSTILPL